MRVLLLGSGGRESALAWGLSRSSAVTETIAAPGNPGIAALAETVPLDPCDPAAVVALARRADVDLVVIGPEAPLVAGVADELRAQGRPVFGPSQAAARLEGSKSYAKRLMRAAGVPTAEGRSFSLPEPAIDYLDALGPPYVVKADGLAAGKGVVVTLDRAEAVAAVRERLVERRFGGAGAAIVIEEYLDGEEASAIAFVDGSTALVCDAAQDFKRALDGDRGPNTGGMGSYSPVPACPPDVLARVRAEIVHPLVRATAALGAPFVGALYAGLALTSRGPRVIEINARFGDPEAQALLPRLDSDLGELCLACARGEVAGMRLRWRAGACVAVVLASGGYPGEHATGVEIAGTERAAALEDTLLFHAGTALRGGRLVTAGGRVLVVAGLGGSIERARERAYEAASVIEFEGKQLRSDIALEAAKTQGGAQ
jgi:phosphoribosylamine--glycine ligase